MRFSGPAICRNNSRNDNFDDIDIWVQAVFSDDTACNVRDRYIHFHFGDGLTNTKRQRSSLASGRNRLKNPDEAPVFWLALAGTQWKYGRLEPQVLQQALSAIDGGSDLARWDADSKDCKNRRAVLDKLRAQLTSSQPPAKRVPKRFGSWTKLKAGELIGFQATLREVRCLESLLDTTRTKVGLHRYANSWIGLARVCRTNHG